MESNARKKNKKSKRHKKRTPTPTYVVGYTMNDQLDNDPFQVKSPDDSNSSIKTLTETSSSTLYFINDSEMKLIDENESAATVIENPNEESHNDRQSKDKINETDSKDKVNGFHNDIDSKDEMNAYHNDKDSKGGINVIGEDITKSPASAKFRINDKNKDKVTHRTIEHRKANNVKMKMQAAVNKLESLDPKEAEIFTVTSVSRIVAARKVKKTDAKPNLVETNVEKSTTSLDSVKEDSRTSNVSNITHVLKDISSSEHIMSPKMQSSVIEVANPSTFNNVFNVAVAQITKDSDKVKTEKPDFFVNPTSTVPLKDNYWNIVDNIGYSDVTLTNDNREQSNVTVSSDDDDFEFAKTSSEFKNDYKVDDVTLTNTSDTTPTEQRSKFMDTVIDMGFYTQLGKVASKDLVFDDKNKGDDEGNNDKNHTPVNYDTAGDTIDFPKETLKNDKLHPHLAELWDKLVTVVDSAVKRIEDNLTEKLLSEIKSVILDKTLTKEQDGDTDHASGEPVYEQCLQCDLVQNQIIDQLMSKLDKDAPGDISKDCLTEIGEFDEIYGFIATDKMPVEVAVGDTVISAEETVTDVTIKSNIAVKTLHFFKENALVVTGVPVFLVSLVLIYILVSFLM